MRRKRATTIARTISFPCQARAPTGGGRFIRPPRPGRRDSGSQAAAAGRIRRARRLRGLLRLSRAQPDRSPRPPDQRRRSRRRRIACPAHFRSDPDAVLQARRRGLGNRRGHGRGAARTEHGHHECRWVRPALFRNARRLPARRGARARTRSPSCASFAAPKTPSSTKPCPSAASKTRSAPPS